METLDPRTIEMLNAVLENVRASVAVEVALADGATELGEREAFRSMGAQEVAFCVTLREWLEHLGGSVSLRVGAVVAHLLETERYDDRLRAFAQHQRQVAQQVEAVLPHVVDPDLRALLHEVVEAHQRSAVWCERHADAFATTRLLDFGKARRGHPAGGDAEARDRDGAQAGEAAAGEAAAEAEPRAMETASEGESAEDGHAAEGTGKGSEVEGREDVASGSVEE